MHRFHGLITGFNVPILRLERSSVKHITVVLFPQKGRMRGQMKVGRGIFEFSVSVEKSDFCVEKDEQHDE